MKTLEERFADARDELERQAAEWERARRRVAALGAVRLPVPLEPLAELDALVLQVHTATGGVPV